jgi:hypothetical protein
LKPRDLFLITALLALLAAAGLIALGGSVAGAAPTAAAQAPAPAELPPAEPEPMQQAAPAAPPALAAEPGAEPREQAAADATSGVVRGHISLSAGVVQRLRSVHVTVVEAAGAGGKRPFQLTREEPVEPALGTPRFLYAGIPFSELGYFIQVWSPGVNGSRQFFRLDREHPVADVVLSVTEGSPFTVLLRDQLEIPREAEKVFLVPIGEPLGRELRQQTTDNYGAALFEDVLQGEYEVRVGAMNASLVEPTRIHVHPQAGSASSTITVPRGFAVEVRAEARGGYGIEGARIRLLATDSVQLREHEATTDWGGRSVFPSVLPGTYQVDVRADDYQVVSRKVVVPEDRSPDPLVVALTRRQP